METGSPVPVYCCGVHEMKYAAVSESLNNKPLTETFLGGTGKNSGVVRQEAFAALLAP